MSQPKKKSNKPRILGILLGILIAVLCRFLPPEYETVCEVVAEITTASCGG